MVFATLADFQHLLQYRTIKFSDFVDVEFGEKASALMPGCCVVVLNEGSQNADTILTNASTIAIICWKGKNNMSIMVSQLDGQELLERLYARFGKHPVRDENENANPDTDVVENAEDGVGGSEVASQGTVSPGEKEIGGNSKIIP
ncbi:tRNA (cytosine(34)-C(5))-methyltransferase isoform X2 [Iris pallida]|uniref:tRNA (Cytosine(34)-C(5))-methyltransferase isoform X2 n=1 Tax=Iris pallida TaxID=29817 RepID=A0AAX6G3Y7_IRIPA|nr:tRNA (cytosine(34)-C(5))-methyltransferase isoform X2 [Iris pallida]